MSEASRRSNGDLHGALRELQRIGNKAVSEAQEASRNLGVPNVFSHRGRIYYELPSGELSLIDPWESRPTEP